MATGLAVVSATSVSRLQAYRRQRKSRILDECSKNVPDVLQHQIHDSTGIDGVPLTTGEDRR
jgi:hypothetical protein